MAHYKLLLEMLAKFRWIHSLFIQSIGKRERKKFKWKWKHREKDEEKQREET